VVRGSPHDAAQCIDFPHDSAFRNPTYGGIARHLSYGFEILSKEEGSGSAPSGKSRGLRPGMAAADHYHIITIHSPL
jgi:hypothetical protein